MCFGAETQDCKFSAPNPTSQRGGCTEEDNYKVHAEKLTFSWYYIEVEYYQRYSILVSSNSHINVMADPRQCIEPEISSSEKPTDVSPSNKEAQEKAQAEEKSITGPRLALITVALISATFLVALVSCRPDDLCAQILMSISIGSHNHCHGCT